MVLLYDMKYTTDALQCYDIPFVYPLVIRKNIIYVLVFVKTCFRILLQAKMCTAVRNSWKSFHIRKTRASENQFFMKKIDFDAKQNSCFVFDMQCPTGDTTN